MTSGLVYYHHPDNDQFSLDFVNPNRDEIEDRLKRYDNTTETRVRSYDLDDEVHVIYVKTNDVDEAENVQYDFDAAFTKMDSEIRPIVRETLEVFKRIQERKHHEEGVPLDAYKGIEIDRIPDALEQVHWSSTVPETGGRIASNLVLCHALPNANHRTAFGMLETYLKAVDSSFRLPSMVTDDYDWQRWVDEYIVDSKRLLTVRRNTGPFRYLRSHGCETVRRKGGIELRLSNFDLEMTKHEALVNYAKKHERRTTAFVETILQKMNHGELVEKPAIERSEFAEYVRGLD